MLARLVLNSWPQVVCLPWPPKVLGLQASLSFEKLPNIEHVNNNVVMLYWKLCVPK